MAGSTRTRSLTEVLSLYADGQMAVDELVPFVAEYPFSPVHPGGAFPQAGTVQEVVAFWQAGQIPDDDYERILDVMVP